MPPATFDHDVANDAVRVLLVGDHLSSVAARIQAELGGAAVAVEPDADVALAYLAVDAEVDCMVLEHDPPAVDGAALLRAVRERSGVPVVLYVADADESDVASLLDAGATDVVDRDAAAAERLLVHRVETALDAGDEPRGVTNATADPPTAFEAVDRPHDERTLQLLRDASRRLVDADSVVAASQLVEAMVADLLSVARATVYLFDEETNVLRPATDDDAATVGPDGSPVWNAFVDGADAVVAPDAAPEFDRPVVVSPLDGYGVLVVEPSRAENLDERAETLVRLVANVAENAFEGLAKESALREREWELDQQSARLERLNQITHKLLGVERAVTHSNTREELESTVCEELANSERFNFVWIGAPDDDGDRLVPRAWSGAQRGYLDGVDLALTPDATEPAVRAVRDRTTVHVPNVSHGLRGERWRQEMLNRGHQSVLSLPLVHDETLYGVLTVCAGVPDAFDDLSTFVFDEIADSTAYGVDAIESKQALSTDSVVELDVRIADSTDLLHQLAAAVTGTVSFEGVVFKPDTTMLYVTVDGASVEAVRDYLRGSVSVDDVEYVADGEGSGLFVISASEPTLVSWVVGTGAVVRELTTTPTETHLVVELPQPANVRGFVENLRERYPETEMLGRHTHERAIRSQQTFMASLTERLTDRQLEVLKTAYLNGYFEWPRRRTGEEIAALLGITQPTFNNHIRVAERKLFTMLFDDEQAADEHT